MSRPVEPRKTVYSVSPSPPDSPSGTQPLRMPGSFNGDPSMQQQVSSSRGAGPIQMPQRQLAPAIPVVGGSGARVPTGLLDRKGGFNIGHDVKSYTGTVSPQQLMNSHVNGNAHTNGHSSKSFDPNSSASSSKPSSSNIMYGNVKNEGGVRREGVGVKREIDLTIDDNDEVQVVDVKGPHLANAAQSSVLADPKRENQIVCIGVIPAMMVSILGLPPTLISPTPARLEDHNKHPRWHRSEWPPMTGYDYYLEPGFRPVEIYTKEEPSGQYSMTVHEVVPAHDVRALAFGSTGLQPPTAQVARPQAKLDSFGRLTEKYPPVLCPWLLKHRLKIYGRVKIVPPTQQSNYLHTVELLLFCSRRDASPLATSMARQGMELFYPSKYVQQEFHDTPPLEVPMWLFPNAMRGLSLYRDQQPHQPHPVHQYHDLLQSRGTMIGPTKEEAEVERRKQVDKVYQSLPDGEKLAETNTDVELVVTPLMPHQKRALTFLLDREKDRSFVRDGKKGALVSLWKPRWQHDKIVSYTHVVTQGEQMKAPHICRGAILADDMGLGKTLTTISLIAKTFDEAREWSKLPPLSDLDGDVADGDDDDDDEGGSDDDVKIEDFKINMSGVPRPVKKVRSNGKAPAGGKKKGKREVKRTEEERVRLEKIKKRSRATLLVLPLTLVSAWESQLREHWAPDCMPKVYVHHGPNRMLDAAKIARHNIVMTTYSTLSSEYSIIATEDDEESSDDADESDDYGGSTVLTAAQKAQRIKKKQQAIRRRRAAERRKKKREEGAFPLQQIEWFRVVLDEAHSIKDPATMQSRAVCDLIARNRLALTGTPVQNRIDDLFALLKFLRLDPFDNRATWNQFCGSPVDGLTLQSARDLRAKRLAAKGVTEDDLDTMSIARVQTLMKFLTLRRTKEMKTADGRKLLELPPKFSRLIELEFDDREKATYNEMRQMYKDGYEKMKQNDTLKYNYATILHEISNLRMTCDHMELVEASKDNKRNKERLVGEDDAGLAITEDGISRDRAVRYFDLLCNSDKANCLTCQHDLTNFAEDLPSRNVSPPAALGEAASEGKQPVLLKCLHLFCNDCIRLAIGEEMYERQGEDDRFACPECGEAVTPLTESRTLVPGDVLQRGGANALSEETFGADIGVSIDKRSDSSTKIRALLADLETFSRSNPASRLHDQTKLMLDQVAADATEKEMGREDVYIAEAAGVVAPIKSIVFSQWTSMLDRVARAVHRAGIRAARLDGRMLRPEREVHLERFKSDSHVEVLLVSLKAGGVGLNLVSACRAYLMEPYWNPAVENQGLDRIYRMGQRRPVVTTKYIMSESIEENMLELQRRKTELAERAGGKRGGTMRREEELNILFGDSNATRNRKAQASQAAGASAGAPADVDSQTESEGE